MYYTLRPMTYPERLYAYTQSSQIGSQTGNIGHLRADMDNGGESFFSTWFDFRSDLKTEEFKEEFDELINDLREDGGALQNRTALSKFCFSHPEAADPDFRIFFFRADTAEHSYMFRLNPNKGEYSCYCYCYRRSWLDRHLSESQRGIKFLDQNYNELFRLVTEQKSESHFLTEKYRKRSVATLIRPTLNTAPVRFPSSILPGFRSGWQALTRYLSR